MSLLTFRYLLILFYGPYSLPKVSIAHNENWLVGIETARRQVALLLYSTNPTHTYSWNPAKVYSTRFKLAEAESLIKEGSPPQWEAPESLRWRIRWSKKNTEFWQKLVFWGKFCCPILQSCFVTLHFYWCNCTANNIFNLEWSSYEHYYFQLDSNFVVQSISFGHRPNH